MVPRVSLTKIRRLTINRHFGKQDETKEDDLRDPGARGVAAPVRSMRCGGVRTCWGGERTSIAS